MAGNDRGIWADYEAVCTFVGCPGHLSFEHAQSAGLKVGDLIAFDPTVPAFGRCPHCRRHQMRVTSVPPPPAIPGPRGFTKIPTS